MPERTSNGGEGRSEEIRENLRGGKPNFGPGYDQQGLLDGLLQQNGPASRDSGEDLMVWLEMREQNQMGSGEEPLPSSEEMVDMVNGGGNTHQEAAEVYS